MIHVRQYNHDKNGRKYPTRQGISMTPAHFASLVARLQELSEAYEHVSKTEGECRSVHIVGGLHVTMCYGLDCVNMCHFNGTDNIIAAKNCITLPISAWKSLVKYSIDLHDNEQKLLEAPATEPTPGEPDFTIP